MSVLGKVLIVLNILAAGGFVYLATADWAAHNAWANAALKHEIMVQGLPLQPTPDLPAPSDEESVPFDFSFNKSTRLTQIAKKTLKDMIPAGGELGGGREIKNQTEEVEGLQKIVNAKLDGVSDVNLRRFQLLTYLLNLAQTGQERDGLNALLRDLFDARRSAEARQDLALLGKTPAQIAALQALVRLNRLPNENSLQDREQVNFAKKALADAARAALPNAVPLARQGERMEGDTGAIKRREEDLRKLINPLTDIVQANGDTPDQGRIDQAKQALTAAGDSSAGDFLKRVGDLAGNPLTRMEDVAEARKKLGEMILEQSRTEAEKQAMTGLIALVGEPKPALEVAIAVGRGLLNAWFEDAIRPYDLTIQSGPKATRSPAEKQSAIAHLLYHIDPIPTWDARNIDRLPDAEKQAATVARDQRNQWHQRVQAVLGMVNYVRAANTQANALEAMRQRLKSEITGENEAFAKEYQTLVQHSLFLAGQFADIESRLKDHEALEASHKNNLELREAEFVELEKEHNKVRTDAKNVLRDLRAEQQQLFQLNAKIRTAQDQLYELERKLRDLEARIVRANDSKGR